MTTPQLAQVAARAAIARQSEDQNLDRRYDDLHDLLNSVIWMLEDSGVELPDPNAPETARAAWL